MNLLKKIISGLLVLILITTYTYNNVLAIKGVYDNPLYYKTVNKWVVSEIKNMQNEASDDIAKNSVCIKNISLPGDDKRTANVYLMGVIINANDAASCSVLDTWLTIANELKDRVVEFHKKEKIITKQNMQEFLNAFTPFVTNNFSKNSVARKIISNSVNIPFEKIDELASSFLTIKELSLFYDGVTLLGVCVSIGGLVALVASSVIVATEAITTTAAAAIAAETVATVSAATTATTTAAATTATTTVATVAAPVVIGVSAVVGLTSYFYSTVKYKDILLNEQYANVVRILNSLLEIFTLKYGDGLLKNNCIVIATDNGPSAWNPFTRRRENQGCFVGTYKLNGIDAKTGEELIEIRKKTEPHFSIVTLCGHYSSKILEVLGRLVKSMADAKDAKDAKN